MNHRITTTTNSPSNNHHHHLHLLYNHHLHQPPHHHHHHHRYYTSPPPATPPPPPPYNHHQPLYDPFHPDLLPQLQQQQPQQQLRPPPPPPSPQPPLLYHHHHQQQPQQIGQFTYYPSPNSRIHDPIHHIHPQRPRLQPDFPPPSQHPPPPRFEFDVSAPPHPHRYHHGSPVTTRPRFVDDYDRNREREREIDREIERERQHRERQREEYHRDRHGFVDRSCLREFVENADRNADRICSLDREFYYRRMGMLEMDRARRDDDDDDGRGDGNGSSDPVTDSCDELSSRVIPVREMPKKSVLLRLQKPTTTTTTSNSGKMTREDYRRYYSEQHSDTKFGAGSFRGKDQKLRSDSGVREDGEEQKRVESPVELDVSFKSNSLIAKPIVSTPSSSSAGTVSGSDSTPKNNGKVITNSTPRNDKVGTESLSRNSKVRRLLLPVKDKADEGSVKSDKSVHFVDNASGSTSAEDVKQSKEQAATTLTGDVAHHNQKPASGGTWVTIERKKVEGSNNSTLLNKVESNAVSGKKPLLRLVKKKQIVKKVAKLPADAKPCSLISQSAEIDSQHVKEDGIANGPYASALIDKCNDLTSVDPVNLQSCSDSIPVLPDSGRVERFAESAGKEYLGSGVVSDQLCVCNLKNCSTSPSASSNHEEKRSNESLYKEECVVCNTDIDCGKSPKDTTNVESGSVQDVGKQFLQNGGSSNPPSIISSEFVDTTPVTTREFLQLSDSGETITPNVARSRSENGCRSLEEMKHSTSVGGDDISQKPTPDRATASLEDASPGDSPNNMVLMGHIEVIACSDITDNRTVESSQLDKSKSEETDMIVQPTNTSISACWVDTTLRLSFKDPSTREVISSGDRMSVRGSSEENGGFSPRNNKKRRFSELGLSDFTSFKINDNCVLSGFSSSSVYVPSREEIAKSIMVCQATNNLPILQREDAASHENLAGEFVKTTTSVIDGLSDDGNKVASSGITVGELSFVELQSGKSATPTVVGSIHHNIPMDVENVQGGKMDLDPVEDHLDVNHETSQNPVSSVCSADLDGKTQSANMDHKAFPATENDLPSVMGNPLTEDASGLLSTNSSGESGELVAHTHTVPNLASSKVLFNVSGTTCREIAAGKVSEDDNVSVKEFATQGYSSQFALNTHVEDAKTLSDTHHPVRDERAVTEKAGQLLSQGTKITTQTLSGTPSELHGKKILTVNPSSKINANLPPPTSSNLAHASKPRTWHRISNSPASAQPANKVNSRTVPAKRPFLEKATVIQPPSYIRKGNSLVRKLSPATAHSHTSQGLSSLASHHGSSSSYTLRKNVGPENRKEVAIDLPSTTRTRGRSDSADGLTAPIVANVPTAADCTENSLDDGSSSPLAEFLHTDSTEAVSAPAKLMQRADVTDLSEKPLQILENLTAETSTINSAEHERELSDVNVGSSNSKGITYFKRKSNQLVATLNPNMLTGHGTVASVSHSDGYYKRRKNQLVRAPVDRHGDEAGESSNPDGHLATNTNSRKSSKKRLRKVLLKTHKPSKRSLVWLLNGAESLEDDKTASHCQKVLPHLFPWKRATYWRASIPSVATNIKNRSLSMISNKLLMLRKRDAVYTRSKNGFALRKTKVLSVGGSSLKWSKSIERRSKKANEEATMAVVEAERKKREHSSVAARTKKRSNCSRERIFRVGLVRYKMDSSRRTLQRISDDESSSKALRGGKTARRSYVPRRLVIGKNEYVRIGNGNQLVRDPKKRVRTLASEKVRWSLHTARSRLARKRKYCQFFTKYGKCSKGDGQCPFIHDVSKTVVCTKFLNGLCSNSDCKLTHKVIPERMPDCSYYLQGLCNNRSCPYRHVHVNPKALVCDEFLRGYCADGNECRKKHSYVCPVYEATGSCPQGSKCKLRHPKGRSKGKKTKRSSQVKNTQGRYFGSMHVNSISGPGTATFEKKYSAVVEDGEMGADFIALDVSDEEGAGEFSNYRDKDEVLSESDNDSLDLESGSLDEVIKPMRIMNI